MPKPLHKGIAILLLVAVLTTLMAFIPNLLSGDVDAWLKLHIGEGYKPYLISLLPFCAVVLVVLTTDAGKWLLPGIKDKPANHPPGTPYPEMVTKVRQYLKSRYEHRLSQKLAGRQPVNLRVLPSVSGISDESAGNLMALEEEDVRGAIGDIFTRANGRLMLVGLPGSGKTTIVLQLALHLLERQDGSFPVVLNLATWRSEFQTFEAWLRKILPAELGASTGLAEQIRKSLPLILLLDGLDEVPEADRDSLITVIGEYGADANRQFLISSRTAEYAVTKDAPVNVQVEVAPLTIEQVEMSLSASAHIQPESRRLLNALKNDPLLRSAVENPFYLNTAQLLFASGKNWSDLGFMATDVTGRQKELVERFVEGALNVKTGHPYPPGKARHWLSFLSSRMTERNMVMFELRDLQYDWWAWNRFQLILQGTVAGIIKSWLGGVIGGVLMGLAFSMFFKEWHRIFVSVYYSLIGSIIAGASLGVLTGFTKIKGRILPIDTRENLTWTLSSADRYFEKNSFPALAIGAISGVFFGLFIGLSVSFKAGLIFGAVSGLVIAYITRFHLSMLDLIEYEHRSILQINKPYERFSLSAKNLHFSIFQHYLLRYLLGQTGVIPFHLVKFLNELADQSMLETDAATWRFRHRILQDYFAEQWVEPDHNHEGKANPN